MDRNLGLSPLVTESEAIMWMANQAAFSQPYSGTINTATRVRQRKDASNPQCRWVPDNEKLWMRVLYCDWMEAEGWVEKKGFESTWLKPAH